MWFPRALFCWYGRGQGWTDDTACVRHVTLPGRRGRLSREVVSSSWPLAGGRLILPKTSWTLPEISGVCIGNWLLFFFVLFFLRPSLTLSSIARDEVAPRNIRVRLWVMLCLCVPPCQRGIRIRLHGLLKKQRFTDGEQSCLARTPCFWQENPFPCSRDTCHGN